MADFKNQIMLSEELFLGIVGFQFIFVLFQWLIFRQGEYVYYLLHILTIIIYFLLLYFSDIHHHLNLGNFSFNILYIEKSVLFLAYGLYISFGRLFLNLPSLNPRLNRAVKIGEHIIFSFCILNVIGLLFTSNFIFHAKIYTVVFTLVFIFSLWVVGYNLFFQKYTLNRFFVSAGIWIAGGTFVSMLSSWRDHDPLITNTDHMLYLQLGILTELFILNIALVHKVKTVQEDFSASQKQIVRELEENKKLNEQIGHIREEISMDLHDEVGSGLSTIRLLTELIKIKMRNDENISPLNKISESSKELVQKMNEIVWALNINNDNLESLIAYIREYTMNFFDNTNIRCVFLGPENIPDCEVEGHSRRAIFLIIKEGLNNIVRHAHATEVAVRIIISINLEILIHDNGTGLQFPSENFSHNGLQNMRRRAEALNGSIQFLNHEGTTILFSVPVNSMLHKSVI